MKELTELKQILEGCLEKLKEVEKKSRKPKKEKYYLKIKNPEIAIGEDYIEIIVGDEYGKEVSKVIEITLEGKLERCFYINSNSGLNLDGLGRIKIK